MMRKQDGTLSYGPVIVAACFSLQAVGLGLLIGYGVFINPLIDEFGWSRAAISGASSMAMFLMGLFSILVGRLSDKIGPRLIVLICAFFIGFGHVMMSRVSTVWHLYIAFGILVGIGVSCADVIALSTTAQWFLKRRGSITGIVKVGAGFGHLLIPMGASLLIVANGWRKADIVLGIGAFLAFVIIGLLLKRAPDLDAAHSSDKKTAAAVSAGPADNSHTLKEAVRTKAFWIICASNLLALYCLMTIMVHIVPHASEMIDSPTRTAGILSVIGLTSMGGRFVIGIIIDRIGSKLTTIFCYILLVLVLLFLQIASAPWMLYLFAVFYGVAHGGLFTIISPIVADYFGTRSHGSLFGIVVFCGQVGGSLGPVLSGRIFDVTGGYSLAFWICTGIAISGLLMMSMLRPVEHRSG
jgi:MFS family permease